MFLAKKYGSSGEEKGYRKSLEKRTERELCRAVRALSSGMFSLTYKYFLKCIYQNQKAEYLKAFGTLKSQLLTNNKRKENKKQSSLLQH